jgi:hypothetical protein
MISPPRKKSRYSERICGPLMIHQCPKTDEGNPDPRTNRKAKKSEGMLGEPLKQQRRNTGTTRRQERCYWDRAGMGLIFADFVT